jgi:hypothetical protein
MTKGTTEETADGMALDKINAIIDDLRYERYQWSPARRVYIPKKNGTKRPLGVQSWSDKLVQEVIRLILDAYLEPQFSPHSHGFRPERGCHTALREIYQNWVGSTWFIEGDISKCFDALSHEVLLSILRETIKDERFIRLMSGLLNAGYLEEWRWNQTYSGMYKKYQATFPNGKKRYKVLQVLIEREGKKPLVARWGGISLHWDIKAPIKDHRMFLGPGRSELEKRLLADMCEYCGATGDTQQIKVHHIREVSEIALCDRLCQAMVFEHARHVQVLNGYQGVVFAEGGREFVCGVLRKVCHAGMLLCQFSAGLLAVLAALLAAGLLAL